MFRGCVWFSSAAGPRSCRPCPAGCCDHAGGCAGCCIVCLSKCTRPSSKILSCVSQLRCFETARRAYSTVPCRPPLPPHPCTQHGTDHIRYLDAISDYNARIGRYAALGRFSHHAFPFSPARLSSHPREAPSRAASPEDIEQRSRPRRSTQRAVRASTPAMMTPLIEVVPGARHSAPSAPQRLR